MESKMKFYQDKNWRVKIEKNEAETSNCYCTRKCVFFSLYFFLELTENRLWRKNSKKKSLFTFQQRAS